MARNPDYQRLLDEARSKIEEVSPQEAHARIGRGAVMLDIRDGEEVAADPSAPGAKHLSRGRLEGGIADIGVCVFRSAGGRKHGRGQHEYPDGQRDAHEPAG